jgi:SAM-dependent methyltransferase
LNQELLLETEKLARSWAQHERAWLRDYLVAGVEDPRFNLQSILSRHFLIRALVNDQFESLMRHEYCFAAVMDWLLRVANPPDDPETKAAILHALRKGSDNAEGLEIPRFVLQTFAALPANANGCAVANYLEAFLGPPAPPSQSSKVDSPLNTFSSIWTLALDPAFRSCERRRLAGGIHSAEGAQPVGETPALPATTLLEPACGSANDYRFLESYGLARFVEYTGFDLCLKNIENAHARFPGVRFEPGNVFEISSPAKAFDLCIIHDLFEHLSVSGLEQAVEEVCRVTRGGICVGFFQMDEIPDHIVRPLDDYHWNLLSMARMKELFASHGFGAQATHIGAFLFQHTGCQQTHNPNAYTFFVRPQ